MKYLKMLGLAAFAAMAFTAFVGAGTASATTLEVAGAKQNGAVTITASLKTGTSAVLRDTFGFFANTCTGSHAHGETSVFTGTQVTGPLTEGENGLSFTGCQHTTQVINPGQLYIEWIPNTTNGTVYSENAHVTTYSTIHGTHITCTTPATGAHIGTLTGVTKHQEETGIKHATLDVNATINCGEHLSSAKWTGTYTVTTPTGLGVIE